MTHSMIATDEDVALRATADFTLLCPRDQKLASGLDGYMNPSDRWTLSSGSVDFEAQGVLPGHVLQLLGPATTFRAPGESMIVSAVAGHSVTLRRKGQASGAGQPPAPIGGLVGIEFMIATLAPQIRGAYIDVCNRVGVKDAYPGRTVADLLDPGGLKDAIVLTVLQRQYRDMSRETGGPSNDALAAKALVIKAELDELLARTIVRWRSSAESVGETSSLPFSARISR